MVRPGDFYTFKKIRVDFMCRVGFRRSRLAIQRLNTHLLHQGCHVAPANVKTLIPKLIAHPSAAIKRVFEVDLIDCSHEHKIPLAHWYRLVVYARSGQIKEMALLGYGQLVRFIDHLFTLGSAMRPSAVDKKSFSIV